jgi:hypothetical protein
MNMRAGVTTSVVALAASLFAAPPAAAQYRVNSGYSSYESTEPNGPSITPYFGYMSMDRYEFGKLGSSTSGSGASIVGVQFMLPLSEHVGILGNFGHANSGLVFNVPEGGGPTIGSSGVWLYDGDIQFSAPFRGAGGHWVDPFIQLGAGEMQYNTQNLNGSASSTNFTFNGGAGLDYAFSKGFGLRLMIKDYVGYWNTMPANTPGQPADRYTNNLAFTGGLKLTL